MIFEEDLCAIGSALTHTEKEFYRDGTILITGCAGSLGYELVRFLLDKAQVKRIIGIDNCCLGCPPWLSQLVAEERIVFYRENIAAFDISSMEYADEVTHVYHMASIASPVLYRTDPLTTMEANVDGCRLLLDYYKDKKLKVFCYFSSSEIYGSPDDAHIPTSENYPGLVNCIGPRACYDEAKRYSETLCWVYAKRYGMPCVVLRPFNIFGPGMKLNDGRIPADCAAAVMQNEDIILFSNGAPTRTFCYVSDAITWILKASAFGSCQTFNIGADQPELTVLEFAHLFAEAGRKLFGYRGQVTFSVSPDPDFLTDNPERRRPDLSRSAALLGFRPSVGVEEGICRHLHFLAEQGNSLKEEWIW